MSWHVTCRVLVLFTSLCLATRSSAAAQPGIPGGRLESGDAQRAAARAEAYRNVASLLTEWRNAWDARDASALAKLYTDDAAARLPRRPMVRSRAAVELALREMLAAASSIAATDVEFHYSASTAILVSCYFTHHNGRAVAGLATAVLHRSGRTWRIRIHMFDPPQPAGTSEQRFSC